MTDPADLTIVEAGRRFRERSLSPVELTQALLNRINKFDGTYHAFLRVTAENALAEAHKAEKDFDVGVVHGPLHGIPYAVKDLIDVDGYPTSCHSKLRAGHIASSDAFVIERLQTAGAVLLGKLALHEFGRGGAMWDLPWPPARNPWDPCRHPGGSSSGSAAAVAARLVPAAIGTDTGGSIRHPATACGIVGLEPTYGSVSRRGVFPLAFSLDTVGPLTRNVEDNAIRFESIAGHDPLDPTSASSAARDCVGGLRQGIRGLRIGVVKHFYREDLCAEAEISAGIDAALGLLTELGARVERVRMSPLPVWCACGETILQAESYAVHELWLRERPHDYSKVCRSKLLTGAFVPASKYIRAQQMRAVLREELKERMRSFDVLVTASGMDPPCRIDIDEDVARTYNRHARMPFNVTGSPAISIPIGLSRLGLPMGIQIAAKALDEPTLYRVAWAYCEAAGSTELCPPLFSPSDLTC